MNFTREQKKGAYKKLSPEVQDLVMSNETTELIDKSLKRPGLSEEQIILADGEILCAMFGLQTLSEAIINIARLSDKSVDDFSGLRMNLEDKVFNKINQATLQTEESSKETPPQNNVEPVPRPVQRSFSEVGSESGVGGSFEQIILNQAKAMREAVPENLPTKHNEQMKVPDYSAGQDPYREPIE